MMNADAPNLRKRNFSIPGFEWLQRMIADVRSRKSLGTRVAAEKKEIICAGIIA
jgi:hypothetical protein